MKYPIWEIPWLGSGWIIGLIATIHVFISQFAVGGGLFLPLMERHARRTGDEAMRAWLRGHAKFFLVLTSAVGASTGVGIWFAISLVHPTATETLIRTFLQLWAIEWVFFLVEVVALAFYYYSWDRVSHATHERIGWVYFASTFGSLFVINGILSAMLTSGGLAETGNPWSGFFNPTFWPTLILRFCICLGLAGVYAFWTAAPLEDEELQARVMRFGSWWVLPAFLLFVPVGFWAYQAIPEASKALLRGGMSGTASGTNSILTRVAMVLVMSAATISAVVYLGPVKNPRFFERGLASGLLALAFVATLATEWVREVVRKPYVVNRILYSSGVRVDRVAEHNQKGHLSQATWAAEWNGLAPPSELRTGEAMFRSQCLACHTRDGYRAMKRLVAGRDASAIRGFLDLLSETDPQKNTYLRFMPPLVGSAEEKRALATYLASIADSSPIEGAPPASKPAPSQPSAVPTATKP